jgi:phospholipid transport system substrate-binding protein
MLRFIVFSFFLLVSFEVSSAVPRSQQQDFVHKVAEDVLAVVQSGKPDTRIRAELETIFTRYIDIDWVGQFVLGKHWRTASQLQKDRFIKAYRSFMIGSYTGRLKEYSGEHYQVNAPRDLQEGKYALTMELFRAQGKPVLIDYKIRTSADSFKIYDIVVEGISLITTQRSEFDSVVSRKGLDALINALNKKAKP